MGAGVCVISLFVTVTATDPERLPQAIATTEAAAESSKIRLRRMTFSQVAGFAATLPCGVCPAELSRRMPHWARGRPAHDDGAPGTPRPCATRPAGRAGTPRI